MKRILYLSAGFLGLTVLFGCCYYFSFRNALLHYNREAIEQNTELLRQLLEYSDNSTKLLLELAAESRQETEQSVETSTAGEEILSPNAEYILETYQAATGIMVKESLPIPGFMVGLSREDLLTYIGGYMEYLPVNEYLAGLTAYEVLSFSRDAVTIRKTYDENLVDFQFYLCEQNGRVTVYYSDLRTVYEYTEIECEELPEEVQNALKHGFYVKDARELYGILEGYTS
ncbi:MAG: hypothetical protein ACI4FZ_01400 [Lachnospiraceae bacterium]